MKKQICKWICILAISLNIAVINGVEELKQMSKTAKKLQHNVLLSMLVVIFPTIFVVEEMIYRGLISKAHEWAVSVVIALCTLIITGIEGVIELTSFLIIFTPYFAISILGAAFIHSIYRCVQIRISIDKGDCVKKAIQTLIASNTFLWIDTYLNCPEFVKLLEISV